MKLEFAFWSRVTSRGSRVTSRGSRVTGRGSRVTGRGSRVNGRGSRVTSRGSKNSSQLGPGRTGQIFVYFAKKSVTSSLRQVRPVVFRSNKFCQGLPNFKDAVVLPQSRTNFLSGVKSDGFVNLYVMFSRKVSIKKI